MKAVADLKTHKTTISLLNPIQIAMRFRPVIESIGREQAIEKSDCFGLLDADVDAAEVCIVHVEECDELGGRIEDGDVVWDSDALVSMK